MNKFVTTMLASGALIAGITSVQAADFGGGYLGAEIGTSEIELKVETTGADVKVSDSGFAYGLFGGYRWDLGGWILGLEGRIGDNDASISGGGVAVSAGREWSASGLVGYQVSSPLVIFATVGYTNLKATATDGTLTESDTVDGAAVSFGLEYAVTEMVSIRGTLTGASYDTEDFDTTQSRGTIGAVLSF